VQPKAKADFKEIWLAEKRADAEKAFDRFLAKYDKATACLAKDREALLTLYDFPRSIGNISAPAIQSRAFSRLCATGRREPRDACHMTRA
jgi:transposase-like protein